MRHTEFRRAHCFIVVAVSPIVLIILQKIKLNRNNLDDIRLQASPPQKLCMLNLFTPPERAHMHTRSIVCAVLYKNRKNTRFAICGRVDMQRTCMAITSIETQTPDSGRGRRTQNGFSGAKHLVGTNKTKKIVNKSFAARTNAEHLFDQRFLTRRWPVAITHTNTRACVS